METRIVRDKIICSGALIYSKSTNRFLLLQKSRGKNQGTWGLVGGTNEPGESIWEGLKREIKEEIGSLPNIVKTFPIESFMSNDKIFNFYTYLCIVEDEFIPILSDEHCAWAWCTISQPPRPLHQGLKNSFSNKIIRTKIQTIFDLIGLI